MSNKRLLPYTFILLSLIAFYSPVRADEKAEPQKFLRFVPEGNDGGRLETAVVTYKNDKGVSVQLIGAVHVADTGYYNALNKQFEGYDALLYEMVKPKDMGAPVRGQQANGINIVHMIQKGLKTALDLDYQLDGVDYTKKNFVHADLDAETFNKMQDERGESLMGLMVQQMIKEMLKGDAANKAQDLDPMQLLAILASEDSSRQLKLMLAKQFENMDEMVAGLDGPNGSVLVTERNKACLAVLKDQIAAGKKNIGIFYGAAHMKDMEKRLVEDMGFKKTAAEWKIAWDMTPKGAAKPAANNAAGQTDTRDEQIEKLQKQIERLEKRLNELDKK